jgi:hypothetical protein
MVMVESPHMEPHTYTHSGREKGMVETEGEEGERREG